MAPASCRGCYTYLRLYVLAGSGREPCRRYAGVDLRPVRIVDRTCDLCISACGEDGDGGRENLPQRDAVGAKVSASIGVSALYHRRLSCGGAFVDAGVWCGRVRGRSAVSSGPREDADVDIRERGDYIAVILIPQSFQYSRRIDRCPNRKYILIKMDLRIMLRQTIFGIFNSCSQHIEGGRNQFRITGEVL